MVRSMKVLIVDDEKSVADSTALVFKKHGHQATTAYSGEEALALVRELKPDILLTDVKMTGLNGIDLAILLCQELPNCKLLLFSGQADTADLLEEAKRAGYEFEILAKPVSPQVLLEKAEALVGADQEDIQDLPSAS